MRKTAIALILALCLLFSAASLAEEKTAAVYADGVEIGEAGIRWFEDMPEIPCMGIRAYAELILRLPLSMETEAEGVVVLRNAQGGELRCDIAAGTISTPDWVKVITPEMPLEGEARGLKDTTCGFVRITSVTYEGEPAPVVFDFARYGMKLHADGQDVYLPVTLLSNMMTDIATRTLRWDGESLFLGRVELEASPEDPVLNSAPLTALLAGGERPESAIRQGYAELCFNFDYFFGHPGVAPLDAQIAGMGLDAALDALGEEGAAIKTGLLSPDMGEYLAALQKLFMIYLFDGHTALTDINALMAVPAVRANSSLLSRLSGGNMSNLMDSERAMTMTVHMATIPQRKLAWGDETYREYGETAIIRLDSFMPDEAAWAAWYRGEGDFPQDCLGIVVTGLRRARENPAIRNVLFDLTCNSGGSSDVLMAILGLTTGRDTLLGRNVLTGQSIRATFEADCNFDGVFDERDREARFDFHYGVLTTRQAFSCGNLFPVVMRESGAVVIGEPTGGGSCCIQVGTDVHGIRYVMSSAQWQLVDENGEDVERGCTVDIPLMPRYFDPLDSLVSRFGVDEGIPLYNTYFDDERLNSLMDAWFHVIPLAPAA